MQQLFYYLRLPLFVLGLCVLFAAERYFNVETYHQGLLIGAGGLLLLSLLSTLLLALGAKSHGHLGEAKGWFYALIWQVAVVLAVGLYFAYGKSLGSAAVPETSASRLLLGAWLLFAALGMATGIGCEWAMRDNRGEHAEAPRVARAALSWLAVGMLFSFLVAFNYFGSVKDVTRDWSYLKVRTPSASTSALLKTLPKDMKIVLFYPRGNEVRGMIDEYFKVIAAKEPRVTIEYFDKDMAPTQAETYRVSRNGQIVLDVDGKRSRIDTGTDLTKARKILKDLDGEFQKSFREITSDKKTLYFTRGHGEASWVGEGAQDQLRSIKLLEAFLRQQSYSVRLFGLAEGSATAVPEDAAAVIIMGPTQPFQKEEVEAIKAYSAAGGNVMAFMDINKPTGNVVLGEGDDPLRQWLIEAGITWLPEPLANDKNYVSATRSPADTWFIFSNLFTSHESVVSLARNDERVAVLVYQGGHLQVAPEASGWKAFETVRALSDTFVDLNRNYKFDGPPEKREGYVLGAVAERRQPKGAADANKAKTVKNGRLFVFADATVVADALVRNQGNVIFFSDSLKWMVGDIELAGELATEEDVKIRHTRKEDVVWFHGTVIAVPLLVLGAGFLATRRGKRSQQKRKGKNDHAA